MDEHALGGGASTNDVSRCGSSLFFFPLLIHAFFCFSFLLAVDMGFSNRLHFDLYYFMTHSFTRSFTGFVSTRVVLLFFLKNK